MPVQEWYSESVESANTVCERMKASFALRPQVAGRSRLTQMNVKQANNVLDLLRFFAEHQRPATLAEIAKHFDWPRSSTFNLLGTLATQGFLYEPRAKEGYYPTPIWAELVQRIERAQPIPVGLIEALRELAQVTGETAVLAAVSGANALFVAAVESEHSVRYTAAPGKMIPLHVTATGRALLSQMEQREREALLRRANFERYTPTTLMSSEEVVQEIHRSLKRGWFEGNSELTPDLGGVALPLASMQRQLAVLVAGPMHRLKGRYPELAEQIRTVVTRHLQ